MARHSWEQPVWENRRDDSLDGGGADADPDGSFWGEASDSESDGGAPPTSPADLLVEKMLNLHLYNKISAEDCCVMMHYASLSGLKVSAGEHLPSPLSSVCKHGIQNNGEIVARR